MSMPFKQIYSESEYKTKLLIKNEKNVNSFQKYTFFYVPIMTFFRC